MRMQIQIFWIIWRVNYLYWSLKIYFWNILYPYTDAFAQGGGSGSIFLKSWDLDPVLLKVQVKKETDKYRLDKQIDIKTAKIGNVIDKDILSMIS